MRPAELRQVVAANVRARRKAMAWRQEDLAEEAQLSLNSVKRLEQRGAVHITTIAKAAAALECDPWELLHPMSL